jgi:O-antigen/teichoic acid export membrane protein
LKIEIDYEIFGWLLRTSFPFALIGALTTICYKIDSVMLSYFVGDSAVGYYNAAYTLVLTLLFIPEAYLESIYPVMSRLHTDQESIKQLNFLFQKSTKYLIGIALPICVGTSLIADEIIVLFFGSDFAPSTVGLQILIWSTLFMFLNLLFSNFLTSTNRQSIAVKAIAIGVSINIILNYLMIPKLSFAGASLATVITEIAILVIYSKYLYTSKYGIGINFIDTFKSMTSCAITGLYILYFIEINILFLITSSVILYITLLYVVGWIGPFEKTLCRSCRGSVK